MTLLNGPYVVGIDVGGANLKYASMSPPARFKASDDEHVARSRYFPMWRRHDSLADELTQDLRELSCERPIDGLAVTMTGELADCFVDRAEGVRHIVNHVCEAATRLKIAEVLFYGVDGGFHRPEQACGNVDAIAAGNWHALGSFVGKTYCRDGILIDVGSTTTDIIPMLNGRVSTTAKTDHERLVEGSLVYVGGRRTPVAALVSTVQHDGRSVPIMNEWFATMDDVRIVLGIVEEVPGDFDTADGKPRTLEMAVNRLARMIGLDRRNFTTHQGILVATQVHQAACRRISDALQQVRGMSGNPNSVLISGHASDLVELSQDFCVTQLCDHLGRQVSRCAPAYAVAELFLAERELSERPLSAGQASGESCAAS